MNKSKIWAISLLLYVSLLFLIVSCITGVIDPFFHYHAPLDSLQYPIEHPRYQNDGIVRHFDYDAMIVGTSMTDNFRTSELDRLFGTNSIKVSTAGGVFDEINHTLQAALQANPDIKLVIYAYDSWFTAASISNEAPDADIPTFLYDRNPFNDVNYLLNKEILFSNSLNVLFYTKQGNMTTTFDDYGNWRDFPFGREETLKNYTRPEKTEQSWVVDEHYAALMEKSLEEDLLSIIREYPNVTFCIYFPPYSALHWDKINQHSTLENDVKVLEILSGLFLREDNVQLYSFHDDYEIVTNLENYRDDCHHTGEINTRILEKIHGGEHRLTLDNYEEYWASFLTFYSSFPFDSLFDE